MKRAAAVLLCLALFLPLTACWSYRGLNELTIVAGVAIDFSSETKLYHISCEIVDVSASAEKSSARAKLVESDGKTVFDAIRNAKKKLINRLYWGNTQVMILGRGLTEEGLVDSLTTWFINDAECRETIDVIVSKEKTAKELLTIYGLDNSIVSYEIRKIIDEDPKLTASLYPMQIYQVYNILRAPGRDLSLPSFEVVKNDGEDVVEAAGQSVFKNERLMGCLTPEQAKYLLFVMNKVEGGILTFSGKHRFIQDTTLEISQNRTNCSFEEKDGKITVHVQTKTDVVLSQAPEGSDMLLEKNIREVEDQAQENIKNQITNLIKTMQIEYNSDIFGFGNMIYKEDPALWEKVGPNWDKQFPKLGIEVQCKVNVLNTSFVHHE